MHFIIHIVDIMQVAVVLFLQQDLKFMMMIQQMNFSLMMMV